MNSPICVDASVVVSLVLRSDAGVSAVELWRRWDADGRVVAAPSLLFYEVCNVLHRYVVRGDLSAEDARDALDAVLSLSLDVHADADLHREALALARRHQLPAAYDAHYLAVAERLHAELWTADRRLYDRVRTQAARVRFLGQEDG